MWKSPTLSPRVIYLLMIIELNSYIHVPTFYFILLYYYYFPCVRVSRVRQAMSRARILSTFRSWVGRSVRGSSPGIGNWHRIANGVDGNWRRI